MKSLKTVQTISKVLSILATIAFVFTIIGAAGSLIGGFSLFFAQFLGQDIVDMIVAETHAPNISKLAIALIAESFFLAGVAVALGFTCRYLKNELKDGTPFTYRGSRELLYTGIISIAVPAGTLLISSVITAIFGVPEDLITNNYDITSGVLMILISFIFTYGADISAQKAEPEQAQDAQSSDQSKFKETEQI